MLGISRRLKLSGSTVALLAVSPLTVNTAVAQTVSPAPVESVVVTGTSIRGIAPVGSNLITVGQQAIDQSGAVNMQQLLQTVPAISTANAAPQGESVYSYYAPQIHSLAGSASNSTLVIMDGLRLPGGGTQGYVQTDPNIIPTIALQRVEVLADGASSIYGSDAVAGVVNFITRRGYEGLQLQAQNGFGNSYQTSQYSLLWGHGWDSGSVMVAAGYTYQSRLAQSAREFTRMGDYTSLGGSNIGRRFGCPVASMRVPGVSGVFLTSDSTTTVPNARPSYNCNTSGLGDNLPESIRENGLIKVNQDFFGGRLSTTLTVDLNLLNTDRRNGPGGVSNVTVYGPGTTGAHAAQINPFFKAPAGAPGATQENVTWVDLMGNGVGSGFGHSTSGEATMYGTFVATYHISDDWEAKLSDAMGYNHTSSYQENAFCSACAYLALNGTAQANASTTATDISGQNTVTLNLPLTPQNALDVWNPAGANNRTSAQTNLNLYRGRYGTNDYNSFNQLKLEADGPLFSLPAGPVRVALGGELVNYHLIHNPEEPNGSGPIYQGVRSLTFRYKRIVYSAYGELNIPLISPDMDIPFMNKVDVDISGRYDKYSDVGPTSNPKYALNWEVAPGYRLRANYSTSFVAPPMGVIGDPALGGMYRGGASVSNGGITVPVSAYPQVTLLPGCAGETVSCTLSSSVQGLNRQFGGGLSNVKPQTGDGWSLGADIAPAFLPGFTASVTLFNNKFKGGVTTPTIALVTSTQALQHQLTICPGGCSQAQIDEFTRVKYGAIFNGTMPSTVYFLFNHDETNVIYLSIQGIDLQARYDFSTDWGDFHVGDNLTEFTKFDQHAIGGPSFSILNTSGLNVTFPSVQTQMRANVGWSDDIIDADVFVNFTGGYRYIGNTAVNPILRDANGNYAGGGDIVKSNTTVDAHVAYNFPDGMLAGSQVYLDAKNLFDKAPPFVNGRAAGIGLGAYGYNNFVSNPIGRVLSFGIRAKF